MGLFDSRGKLPGGQLRPTAEESPSMLTGPTSRSVATTVVVVMVLAALFFEVSLGHVIATMVVLFLLVSRQHRAIQSDWHKFAGSAAEHETDITSLANFTFDSNTMLHEGVEQNRDVVSDYANLSGARARRRLSLRFVFLGL
jgi:hypothetical protein